jgi:arsenical pump membrane protein
VLVAVAALLVALAIALAWRSAWAPAAGALTGLGLALAGGVATGLDIEHALGDLWRPMISIVGIMATTSCAAELGIFTRLAGWIEPRTRGPVKHAFRLVYALAAVTAAVLSNDAAILLLTPMVLELLRAVYPRRNPKFLLPFAFAAFVAAGVAPLPTGNPMNLVVAYRAGIGFNGYVLHMLPVAVAGWLVAYLMLAWYYRGVLADAAPALGAAPPTVVLGGHAKLVLIATGASVVAYPVLAAFAAPIWPVALPAALVCVGAALHGRVAPRRIAAGISWELLPFLFGVLVLATALARAGVTDSLRALYVHTPFPVATVGAVAAAGSALIGNHPLALLHSLALADAPDPLVYAALVGGDLGPRLLPIGSLAGLLWSHQLRQRGVVVPLGTFVRVGFVVTVPSLVASLAVLWLVA